MNVKEKLVELLDIIIQPGQKTLGDIADLLIANGVTVQEWISVEDRLPKDSGDYIVVHRNKYNGSISTALDTYIKCKIGGWWANDYAYDVIHWMPLPEMPKENDCETY